MTTLRADGRVEFRFFRPDVSRVSIAGNFNNWRDGELPMQRDENGWWVATAELPAGEYRFRYNADGRWFTDFASHGVEPCAVGLNSVLVIPKPRTAVEHVVARQRPN